MVRPDLWKATLDYSSGTSWSWDRDSRSVTEGGELRLPTVTKQVMDGWRAEFATEHAHESQPEGPLAEWRERGLGAGALPPSLRGTWYAFLRSKVETRLSVWFDAQAIDPPEDLLVEKPPRQRQPGEGDLRAYLFRAVRQMMSEELRMVQLPAVAVARLGSNRS